MVFPHPLWVTAAFDLDGLRNPFLVFFWALNGARASYGNVLFRRLAEVVATLRSSLADKIMELRKLRA